MYQFQTQISSHHNTILTLKGVNDLDNSGLLIEVGSVFSLSDEMNLHMYLNKIKTHVIINIAGSRIDDYIETLENVLGKTTKIDFLPLQSVPSAMNGNCI